jgi:hypothetical protein
MIQHFQGGHHIALLAQKDPLQMQGFGVIGVACEDIIIG